RCSASLRRQLVSQRSPQHITTAPIRHVRALHGTASYQTKRSNSLPGSSEKVRDFSSTAKLEAESAAAAAPAPPSSSDPSSRLSPDNLFHSFTNSPVPEFRRRAAFMREHAFCPHPDHQLTRVPTIAPQAEDQPETGGSSAPCHVDFECPDCGIPVYCSKEHWMDDYENHLKVCDTLRQINEDDHDLRSGRVFHEANLPDIQMEHAMVNMTNWDTFMYTREFDAVDTDRSMRQITRLLTYPITVGSVLHELSPYNIKSGGRLTIEGLKSFSALRYNLHPQRTGAGSRVDQLRPEPPAVRIFVLGARAESSLPRATWIQLSHLFPDARFHLIFIGPESMANRDDEFPLPARTPENPWGAVVEDRVWYRMKISTIVDYYHTIHKTGYFAPHDPYFDCFVLFHPGLGHPASSHDWEETLPLLLETKVPIISTGYTQFDLERDVEWVKKKSGGEFDILLEPGQNSFRSLRWDLNDLDPQDVSSGNWGVWAFRGKRAPSLCNTKRSPPLGHDSDSAPSGRRRYPDVMTTVAAQPLGTPAPHLRPPTSSATDTESKVAAAARRAPASDPLSARATSALIRRTLCPQQLGDKGRDTQKPIEELLPPLTSRNDVDLELYAFLAIILRQFVQSWYGKITSDENFVAEIVHIIAHLTRALEQRSRKVDWESLLLDQVPDLLDKHITAHRAAHRPAAQSHVHVEPRQVYHALIPLPSLSPVPLSDDEATVTEQKDNESAYRQLLVQAVLAILLPTEDLENPCLTAIVGQIFSELIIGNLVANRVAQPWLIWEGICILANLQRRKRAEAAERLAASTGGLPRKWNVHGFFLSLINLVIVFITSIRLVASAVVASSSLPPRLVPDGDENEPTTSAKQVDEAAPHDGPKAPILSFSIWSCAGNLIELPSRMPWLSGMLSLVLHGCLKGPGRIGRLNGTVDRFLSHYIQSLISSSHLPHLLRTVRGVLFPNNAPGKSSLVPPSSDEELLALRRRAASALWSLVPSTAGRLYLGGRLLHRGGGDIAMERQDEERMVDQVECLLMVFSDEYCNKHLVYGVLELVLVKLMPELIDKGVEELWEERLGER
ncbi:unnamed protein product, partial [Clonostachys rosea f. rosea IK726]